MTTSEPFFAEPPLLRPWNLAEFIEMTRDGTDAVIAGGGTLVIPGRQRQRRPPPVVYVPGITELRATGASLRGAGTTLAELADDPAVSCAVRAAAASVGGPAVRTTATVGGNIGAARPGCVAVALLALDCVAEVLASDGRLIPVPLPEMVGRSDRLITTVRWDGSRRSRFAKVRAGSMGPVLSAVAVSTDRTGRDPRVAIGGQGIRPQRVLGAESLLADGECGIEVLLDTIRPRMDGTVTDTRTAITAHLIERVIADLNGRAMR